MDPVELSHSLNDRRRSELEKLWLLALVNLPLLQEVTRKYLIHSDFVYLAADVLVLITTAILLFRGRVSLSSIPSVFWLFASVFIVLGLYSSIAAGRHMGTFFVGLRASLLPIFYMIVASRYYRLSESAGETIFRWATLWVFVAATVAALQLVLGKSHSINLVWGESLGIGDYGGEGGQALVDGLFRPTSIFTHTGKFGQAIFCLILFRWCYLAFSETRRNPLIYLTIVVDLVALFASGQRAAVLFLGISLLLMFLLYAKRYGFGIVRFAGMVGFTVAVVAGLGFANLRYAAAILDRFSSTIGAVPVRLTGNFVYPMQTMIDEYLFAGEGLGFFTFGSSPFGGTLVYRYITMEGLGESSFVRLCGEVGVVAAVFLVVAYGSLIVRAWSRFRSGGGSPATTAVALYFLSWSLCQILWSNTADVFANSMVTCLAFALGGAILLRKQPERH